MNVTCPNCATIYRIDPAKVPESGVRTRCGVCNAVFAVRREAEGARTNAPASAVATPAQPPVSTRVELPKVEPSRAQPVPAEAPRTE
ncbi:MAG TPA: zinc-ribbon domain-containing protein, partial [Gemmatimonadales bacterium]|nr:zinc-ribbon domain-containing protein [Gemmatimonadales bacterium]